jgi:hypothetical protein
MLSLSGLERTARLFLVENERMTGLVGSKRGIRIRHTKGFLPRPSLETLRVACRGVWLGRDGGLYWYVCMYSRSFIASGCDGDKKG